MISDDFTGTDLNLFVIFPLLEFLSQQGLDIFLCLLVSTFANMHVTDVTLFVDEIQRGPVMVLICPPGSAVVILCNCVFDPQAIDRIPHIIKFSFIGKFRVVISNDDQPLVCIIAVPILQRRNYMLTINSTKCPHVYQHDFTFQVGQAQGGVNIQPGVVR